MNILAKVFFAIAFFGATFFLIPISNAVRNEELPETHLFVLLAIIFGMLVMAAISGIAHYLMDGD